MSGIHFDFAMIKPFNNPQSKPVIIPQTITMTIPYPFASNADMTTAESAMIFPIERSIPPLISSILIAIVSMPITEICPKMVTIFFIVINLGLITVTLAIITNITSSKSIL